MRDFISFPPDIVRRLMCPGALWCLPGDRPRVYLTFDDGPIPEMTPQILEILGRYGIKATFFMVGDNVRKHPDIYRQVLDGGHRVGNHTMHHLRGIRTGSEFYVSDVAEAAQYMSTDLFRPPHGFLRAKQLRELSTKYRIVMFDVVTRDYSRHVTKEGILERVKKYVRNGSVIVFHDSLKSNAKTLETLPLAIEWLIEQGYEFGVL